MKKPTRSQTIFYLIITVAVICMGFFAYRYESSEKRLEEQTIGLMALAVVAVYRPGYYALYDRVGLQVYSPVIPYASEAYDSRINDEIEIIDCLPSEWYRHQEASTSFRLSHSIKDAEAQLYEKSGSCGYELIM